MAVPFQKHTSRSVLRHQLNDVIPEYRTYLENQDLAPSWIDTLVGTARHIVLWLSFNGIEIEALDIRKIAGFMSMTAPVRPGFNLTCAEADRGPTGFSLILWMPNWWKCRRLSSRAVSMWTRSSQVCLVKVTAAPRC